MWIVKNEMVTEIEDVLMRRTRATFLLGKEDVMRLVPVVGEIMAE